MAINENGTYDHPIDERGMTEQTAHLMAGETRLEAHARERGMKVVPWYVNRPCYDCGGEGTIIVRLTSLMVQDQCCESCEGKGYIKQQMGSMVVEL